ncbi:hypothetical protein D3C73_1001950 [compost metagenome]
MGAQPAVEFQDFLIVQPGIRLGDGHQRIPLPQAEGVVGVQGATAAMAGLRIEQHRVDGERVDLPLPPIAAPPSALVAGRGALEHEAFHVALARFAAQFGGGFPRARRHRGRQRQSRVGMAAQQRLQQRAAFSLGPVAQVGAVLFQQVVGQHPNRCLGQPLGAGL